MTVERVIDGDTFVATGEDGEDLGRVRVIGIDSPELERDGRPAECHAEQARVAATQMLDGSRSSCDRQLGSLMPTCTGGFWRWCMSMVRTSGSR